MFNQEFKFINRLFVSGIVLSLMGLIILSVGVYQKYNTEYQVEQVLRSSETSLEEKQVEYLRRISVSLEDISREMRRVNR